LSGTRGRLNEPKPRAYGGGSAYGVGARNECSRHGIGDGACDIARLGSPMAHERGVQFSGFRHVLTIDEANHLSNATSEVDGCFAPPGPKLLETAHAGRGIGEYLIGCGLNAPILLPNH